MIIDTHAHWFSAKIMSEKEFILASAESWLPGEINNSRLDEEILKMNELRPFYLLLKKEMKKFLGENFIEERNRLIKEDPVNYIKILFEDAKISAMVIDEGFGKKEMELPIPYKLLFRIEKIINDELFSKSFDKAIEYFIEILNKKIKEEKYAGFKSIIAYRTGLKVVCDEDRAKRDFLSTQTEWYGRVSKGFRDYLLCITLEIAKKLKVPVQIHTGAGDRDIKLEDSRPAYLTNLVRKYEGKVILVHAGYPYHRESAWMSYIFPSVYLDVSQVVPFAPLASYSILKEIYEVAPLNKVMYGSDAFNIPEIAWLGAKLAKNAIENLKNELINKNILDEKEVNELEDRFFHINAKEVYGDF
ncbi:MAG: amidohydrolase family protein [Sulfolobaceae archaeon]